jgi:uncharacterized protein (UPF0333 family)
VVAAAGADLDGGAVKVALIVLALVAAGVGAYFLIYRPRKAAESKVAIQAAAKTAASFLRGAPLAA